MMLAALHAAAQLAALTGGPPAWQQDAFWISFWVGPQVALPELDGRFAEIAEANFTGYLGFDGHSKSPYGPNATRVAKEIELCDKHGLKCVPSLCGKHMGSVDSPCIGLGKDSPNFWGYQLLDEVGKFDEMAAWHSSLAAVRPAALNFFNLLGDTPFASTDIYSAYINAFVQTVKPNVVSMDFYPAFGPASDAELAVEGTAAGGGLTAGTSRMPQSKDDYGQTLGVLRQQAENAPGGPIPFWQQRPAIRFESRNSLIAITAH